ncbi:MAG: hypothetical protein ACM3UU_02255 [Ignavibacteriales bacterium]
MKVLVAINNDAVSEASGNFYQREYNNTLEIKNVYYFKALLEEIKLISFDSIIIHEELEPFSTLNQEVIDNNLFEIFDKISDEGRGANIIFISSERRKRDDKLIRKMFNIGIYNILIGEDRTIEEVAKLLNKPRTKKEAKSYIDYDLDEDAYGKEDEVSETELNRILVAYESAAGDEQKYVEIFDRIAEQYTDVQLRVIVAFLPEHVKRVLYNKSEKFRSIIALAVPDFVDKQNIESFKDEGEGEYKIPDREEEERPVREVYEKEQPQMPPVQPPVRKYEEPGPIRKEPDSYAQQRPYDRQLAVQTPVIDSPTKYQKFTEVIEKEIIREVYETPKDYRKVVCFVGAHKSGTTFLINAIASYLTRRGIKTAIFDATRNKDSYFIYAINNENSREVAAKSLFSLSQGRDLPLEVNRMSVYTAIPGHTPKENMDYVKMVELAKSKNSVVLIDCDFDSPLELFKICQNIYIVQDMDILNLQPITSFLRELKYRGIDLQKGKVIVNKHVKCALPAKRVIEGISYYSNPEMTIYDELFVKNINYYIIPFDDGNQRKYLEGLYLCKLNYTDFTEDFKEALEHLASSVYPVGPSRSKVKDFKNIFSSIKNMMAVKKKSEDDADF